MTLYFLRLYLIFGELQIPDVCFLGRTTRILGSPYIFETDGN
jgi:hypothetical protein